MPSFLFIGLLTCGAEVPTSGGLSVVILVPPGGRNDEAAVAYLGHGNVGVIEVDPRLEPHVKGEALALVEHAHEHLDRG